MRATFFSPAVIAFLVLFSGCGYAFQGSGSILPPDVKTIAIPLAENNTTEPGVGMRFTESLKTRFDRYGAVKVVENEGDADAILTAKVLDIKNSVRDTTSNTDIELESELIVTISAELKKKNGQILYRNSSMSIPDSAATTGDVVVTSSSQFAQSGIGSGALDTLSTREVQRGQGDQVIEDLLEEASRRIYLEAVAQDF